MKIMKLFHKRHTVRLSIVVIVYNMRREAERTLYSLSPAYQRGGVGPEDYEVIVVDNGSNPPLGVGAVRRHGPHYRYFYLDAAEPSPAQAVNYGVRQGHGEFIGILVDGARLVTPNLVSLALLAFRLHPNPVVSVMGWHLGPERQNLSIRKGYNQAEEDRLLASIGWPHEDPYRLFGISSLGGSSQSGCFLPFSESNALFLNRKLHDRLGGFDERFRFPGGGLVNLDYFHRCLSDTSSHLINLLGEGCFHQIHAGVSTNIPPEDQARCFAAWNEEYKSLRGHDFVAPDARSKTWHFGPVSPHALPFIQLSAEIGIQRVAAAI